MSGSGNGHTRTVEIAAIYECAEGERFSPILVGTDTTSGREGEHVVIYHQLGQAEILVRSLAEWCEIVNGRPRFWRVDEEG